MLDIIKCCALNVKNVKSMMKNYILNNMELESSLFSCFSYLTDKQVVLKGNTGEEKSKLSEFLLILTATMIHI